MEAGKCKHVHNKLPLIVACAAVVQRDGWQVHGVKATVSDACFGPYKTTYGAFPNDATHHCGVISYNEYKNMLTKDGGPEVGFQYTDSPPMLRIVQRRLNSRGML